MNLYSIRSLRYIYSQYIKCHYYLKLINLNHGFHLFYYKGLENLLYIIITQFRLNAQFKWYSQAYYNK